MTNRNDITCPRCGGDGAVTVRIAMWFGPDRVHNNPCNFCEGSGGWQRPKEKGPYRQGDKVRVISRYGALNPGHEGTVTKAWTDPHGNGWIRLDLGTNKTGQRLRHVILVDHVEPAEPASTQGELL